MPPSPITSEQYVSQRLGELIQSDGEVGEFQFRRLLAELKKVPNPIRRDCLVMTLLGLAGEYAEARKLADAYIAMPPEQFTKQGSGAVIDLAAALHAAQRFKPSGQLLRYLLEGGLLGSENGALALQVATGVYAFNLAGDIMQQVKLPTGTMEDYPGSNAMVSKVRELGMQDEPVQSYVQACVDAVMPWVEGRRRALMHSHMVIEETDQVVIDLEVAADPDDFGDIMWAVASIDKAAYSENVSRHILVDVVPLPGGAE